MMMSWCRDIVMMSWWCHDVMVNCRCVRHIASGGRLRWLSLSSSAGTLERNSPSVTCILHHRSVSSIY